MPYCTHCGTEVKEEDYFCSHCGTRLKEQEPNAESISDLWEDKILHVKTRKVGTVGKIVDWIRNFFGLCFVIYGIKSMATDSDFNMDFAMTVFCFSTMAIWYRLLWKGRANWKVEIATPFLVLLGILILELIMEPI